MPDTNLARLYKEAGRFLKEAKKNDTGRDDWATRAHWYWEGYTLALLDAAANKDIPTLPRNGAEDKDA